MQVLLQGLSDLRAICSAPGKVILFGEHAVVYGHPAIATAIDQRTEVEADCCGTKFTVNGFRIHERYHTYLLKAVDMVWTKDEPIRLQTEGGVPSASGTGSSAALTVATVGALHRLLRIEGLDVLAQVAYDVEREAQGGGSPTDTSTSVAGGGIAIGSVHDRPGVGEPLWDVTHEERGWAVERVDVPELSIVIGNSGVKSKTNIEVAKVARAVQKNAMVRDTLKDIGDMARDAVPALRREDWSEIGRLMDRTHQALHMLGVNHPAVQTLIDAAKEAPGTLGAKITGAGGGGSMIALCEKPEAVAERIRQAGGTPYIVKTGSPGVAWQEDLIEA